MHLEVSQVFCTEAQIDIKHILMIKKHTRYTHSTQTHTYIHTVYVSAINYPDRTSHYLDL